MERARIVFRADGHRWMGLGHVIRSLALAEMLKEDFDMVFAIRMPLPSLEKQIRDQGIAVIHLPNPSSDLLEVQWLCREHLRDNDIVVVDGYHFATDYQQVIKDFGCQLVAIDDIHAFPFLADVVINHALGIADRDYQIKDDGALFLGTKYSLLRKVFLAAQKRDQQQNVNQGPLLLCLGGADPNNDSLRILQRLRRMGVEREIKLVVGAAYAHSESLEYFLQHNESKVEVFQDLSASDLLALFYQCPLAILPPSTIAYEYLNVGGLLFLEVIADNQKRMFESFVAAKLAFPLDKFQASLTIPQQVWQGLLSRQTTYFDGQQQARFKHIFAQLAVAMAS